MVNEQIGEEIYGLPAQCDRVRTDFLVARWSGFAVPAVWKDGVWQRAHPTFAEEFFAVLRRLR